MLSGLHSLVPESSESEKRLALRVFAMPKDTNHYGTIFGGVILSYVDQAGFIEASRHGMHRWVTAAIDHVDFVSPVFVGDTISCYAYTKRTGTTSVTVCVDVMVERHGIEDEKPVTTATLTMVAVDEDRKPIPFNSPATVGDRG